MKLNRWVIYKFNAQSISLDAVEHQFFKFQFKVIYVVNILLHLHMHLCIFLLKLPKLYDR